MNKIKKVFISFGAFLTGLASKVSAVSLSEQTKYGVYDPRMYETKYGVFEPEPSIGEKILSIGKITLPVILFIIGLFVILSKKLTKKVKVIVVSSLIILAVLGYVLMNYIATNFKSHVAVVKSTKIVVEEINNIINKRLSGYLDNLLFL